jgi:hypothetical protein
MTYTMATEQFIDLVVADQELLDAEFAAIIAASWPNPTPPAGRDGSGGSESPAGGPSTPIRTLRSYRTQRAGGAICRAAHARGGGRSPPAPRAR